MISRTKCHTEIDSGQGLPVDSQFNNQYVNYKINTHANEKT